MSIIPEKILQQVLIKGFKAFRDDNRLIDTLFHNLTLKERDSIKNLINTQIVDINYNYPDRNVRIPCCVLLLKGETESEGVLGELFQSHTSVEQTEPRPHIIPSLQGDATIVGRGSSGPVWGKGEIVLDPITIEAAGVNYVDLPNGTTVLIDPFEETSYLEVLEGTGEGQRVEISSIDPRSTTLPVRVVVNSNFSVTPDDTSVVQIVNADDAVGTTGDASKVFEITDKVERLGALYKVNYQLVLLTGDQDHLLWLYSMIKAMMIINREFMIKQGFMNLKIGGADFLPRSEMQPQLVYQRSMTFDFDYSFDVYNFIQEPTLSSLVIALSVNDPDVSQQGVEVEVSNTTTSLT